MDELLYTVDGAAAAGESGSPSLKLGCSNGSTYRSGCLAIRKMLGGSLRVITSGMTGGPPAAAGNVTGSTCWLSTPTGTSLSSSLKRDEAPETVELQALKYAAILQPFYPETLVEEYSAWRRQSANEDVDAWTDR